MKNVKKTGEIGLDIKFIRYARSETIRSLYEFLKEKMTIN